MSKIIKHGLDYIFNNDEYIKLDILYNDQKWYTEYTYKIKQYHRKNIYANNIEDYYELYSNNEFITLNISIVIQDKECLKLNRKEKLKKIGCQKYL